MPYELVKKVILEDRPKPCDYCDQGWKDEKGKTIPNCSITCENYEIWIKGGVIIPEGYAEVREIKGEQSRKDEAKR